MFEGPSKKGDIDVFLIGLDAAAAERKVKYNFYHFFRINEYTKLIFEKLDSCYLQSH